MIQLIQPNLNTVGNIGWCLSFAEDAFNTPHLYATATDGWNATKFKRTDSLPNAYVPVWFSYVENGINYGHVAVYSPDGRVLSSPYKKNNSQQWFSSIQECERVLNCKYLGWSEDIATIRIVKEGEQMTILDKPLATILAKAFCGNGADENLINRMVGMESNTAIYWIEAHPSHADYLKYLESIGKSFEAEREVFNERIKDLTHKLELAQAGNEDTQILNNLGKALFALIKRVGLKG